MDQLGRGAMGVVLRVRSVRDGRERAMKVLLGDHGIRVKRFAREIHVSRRLQHPNLVQVEECGELDGRPWFVMPLIPGEDLTELVKRGDVTPDRAAQLVAVIARAVHHAHSQGIVHRDLKPGNIRIAPDGVPHVLDFGMAKDHDAAEALSRTGFALGTPSFWAPEQAQAQHRKVDARTDVYALGVILFELLTGRPIFPSKSTTELVEKIVHSDPPRPSEIRKDVPRRLEDICLRCLRKSKAERYPSALSLAEALERYLSGDTGPRSPVPRWVWVLGAAAVCGGLGILGGSLLRRAPPTTPPPPVSPSSDDPADAPTELPLARAKIVAALSAAQGLSDRDDYLAALRKLETRLTGALARAAPAAAAELKLHRGRIRRALGRWDAAAGDLEDAAAAPHVMAEAVLARSVIRLRWEEDAALSTRTLSGLRSEPGDSQASKVATRIAEAYALIAVDRTGPAAERALALVHEDLPAPLAEEAYQVLAFAARRASERGDVDTAIGWIEQGERYGTAPRNAYLYLADRAAILARAGRLEEAAADLELADRAAPEAWSHLTTRLILIARRGELQTLREQRDRTLVRARERGREDAMRALLDGLQAEALEASHPAPEEGVSHPGVLLLEDTPTTLDLTLPPGIFVYHLVLDLEAPEAYFELRGADEDLDMWIRRDRRPEVVGDAYEAAAGPGYDENMLAVRLKPGLHHLVISRVSHSPAPLGLTLTLHRPPSKAELPQRWPNVRDLGFPIGDEIEDAFAEALEAWGSGDQAGASKQLEALEQEHPPSRSYLRFVHAELLASAGRGPEAEALLNRVLAEGGRPPLDRRAPFLRAQLALAAGRPAESLSTLQKILARRPQLLDAQLLLVEAALATGDLELADAPLASLREQAPAQAAVLEGALLLARGEPRAAYSLLALRPEASPPLTAVRRAVIALLKAQEPERGLRQVEVHAARWPGGDVLAVERWACRIALGEDATPPTRESLSPAGQLRLARLRVIVGR